ncbi:VOC family protein [bacterium]|nr:VOC family protein [bacterium]
MQQQVSVITLGIADLGRARRFYEQGFGWTAVFANDEIVFFQMNGFVLGLWLASALEAETGLRRAGTSGAFAMAHNVPARSDVQPVMDRLVQAGGTVTRAASAPPHGGYRGYVADPDGHSWEIAWNPAWAIDDKGHVSFGL